MLKTTPLVRGSFGGYLLPHKGFQDAGTFSRLVGTTPLLRGTLTPLIYLLIEKQPNRDIFSDFGNSQNLKKSEHFFKDRFREI